MTHDEVRGHILGMVEGLSGVASIEQAIAALVAALGVASALSLSVMRRQRGLGLVRAIGATPDQVMAGVLAEAWLLSVLGLLLGLLLGAAAQWYVVRVLLAGETGFLFPIRLAWWTALCLSVIVPLIGLAAGLLPGRRAARLRVTEAVACA